MTIINPSDFCIALPKSVSIGPCYSCGCPTVSIPLKIINKNGESLCTVCSEKHLPFLNECMHLYLAKHPIELRKLKTSSGKRYTLMVSFRKRDIDLADALNDLAIDLCLLADTHDVNTIYYVPLPSGMPITDINLVKQNHENIFKRTDFLPLSG